ncbi:hypothetical protein [Streptomyces smyrnaeus]|uniref:hypothetical protein n=2 Tax=Streptomyces smyrnaeus TaxID=1387713 RepID=UPI0033E61354
MVDGRDDWVTKGDELRVRYDPEGVAGPTEDKNSSSYGGLLASLFVAAVVMGTWGGVRQNIGRLVLMAFNRSHDKGKSKEIPLLATLNI